VAGLGAELDSVRLLDVSAKASVFVLGIITNVRSNALNAYVDLFKMVIITLASPGCTLLCTH
jgi:hypothetical protein